MRRRQQRPVSTGDNNQYRVNHQIRISQILVIGPSGEKLGVMSPEEGRAIARNAELDLVEVAPTARPPVCRVMDYGKFRYEQAKKAASLKSKAGKIELKTLRLRPKTDDHDLDTMLRKARSFIEKGDRVKFDMRMRGREQAHCDLWVKKMEEVVEHFKDIAQVAQAPRVEGRVISATIEPLSGENKSGNS